MADDTKDFVPASLGVDLGNYNSKQALCFSRNGKKELRSVEFRGRDHLGRPCPPNSLHEISGRTGLDANGKVVIGRAALEADLSFTVTIKTLLLYGALGPHEVVKNAHDGPALLDAIKYGRIDDNKIDEMILRHLCLLWDQTAIAAKVYEVNVVRCALTYPGYLDEDCTEVEVDIYIGFIERKARQARNMVLPRASSPDYYTCNEGQGIAQYIWASLRENIIGSPCHTIRELWKGMNTEANMPLVIYDGGSSSLNIHVLEMGFDKDLQLANIWTINIPGLSEGVQGGSDAANSELRRRLPELLKPLMETSSLPPAAEAVYIRDFEAYKRGINFDEDSNRQLRTILGAKEADDTIPLHLSGQLVRDLMHVGYDSVLNLIIATNRRLCEFKVDLAILYCGGTLINPGARSVLDRELKVLEAQGNRVRAAYLTEEDGNWSAAAAAGAAFCTTYMPLPGRVLKDSAIGIQRLHRAPSTENWVGENVADIIFCEGAGFVWSSTQVPCDSSTELQFSLVIDPDYKAKRSPTDTNFTPIKINAPEDVFSGSHATHDLGLRIDADDLPRGQFRFELHGDLLEKIAQGAVSAGEEDTKEIPFILSCVSLNKRGTKHRSLLDKQWQGFIRTDPGSQRLMIDGVQKLAMWCTRCSTQLEEVAHACVNCSHYFLCSYCIMQKGFKKGIHPPDHSFKKIQIRATWRKEPLVIKSQVSTRPETAAARRARADFRKDFPTGAKPISTSGEGRQCAWRALVASWNAQRGRRYRDITLKELTKHFEGLRDQSPSLGDLMENTHTYRVDQMALNIQDFALETFGVTVQMGYIYPKDGVQREVLVPIADGLKVNFRLWVSNNNIEDDDWTNAHFEGLGHSYSDKDMGVECSEKDGAGPLPSRRLSARRMRFKTAAGNIEENRNDSRDDMDELGEEWASFAPPVTTARPGHPGAHLSSCDSCRREKLQCYYTKVGQPCRECTRRKLPCELIRLKEADAGSRSSSCTVCDEDTTRLDGGDDKAHGGPEPKHKMHYKQAAQGIDGAKKALTRAERAWSVANIETILPEDIVPSVWTTRSVSSINHLARLTGVRHRDWAVAELKKQVDARPIPQFENRRTIREAAVRATIEAAKKKGIVS